MYSKQTVRSLGVLRQVSNMPLVLVVIVFFWLIRAGNSRVKSKIIRFIKLIRQIEVRELEEDALLAVIEGSSGLHTPPTVAPACDVIPAVLQRAESPKLSQ